MHANQYLIRRAAQLPPLVREIERRVANGPLRVRLEAEPSRTREQNAYLHVAIRALADHTGARESDLREYFKDQYGPTVWLRLGRRKPKLIAKSIADYTLAEASAMIEHVERTAAECGLLMEPSA
jgi:hypothetical protein